MFTPATTSSLAKYITLTSQKSQIRSEFYCLIMLEVIQDSHFVIKVTKVNTDLSTNHTLIIKRYDT